jgi:SAM-dependent methyltransferase
MPDARFDLVTSFDVLYGLPDDVERAALGEMARVLKPGGSIIVNVAALPWLRGNHSVLGGELRRYRRKELIEKLEAAGFRVMRSSYTNFSILPMIAAVRAQQRLSGHDASDTEISVPPAPINAALSALLGLEAAALRLVNMPLGSSVVAVGQKLS